MTRILKITFWPSNLKLSRALSLYLASFLCLTSALLAQSPHYQRYTSQAQGFQKLQALNPNSFGNVHTGFGNVWRSDMSVIDSLESGELTSYLIADNPEFYPIERKQRSSKFWNTFYPYQSTFLAVEKDQFKLYVNPLLHLEGGKESTQDNAIFRNTRGYAIRGYVNDRIYFFTDLLETQANFRDFQNTRFADNFAIDGQGFYKDYNSAVSSLEGFDFLNARGYLGVPISKNITFEIGHGGHFIGHGYHSLLLNDYGNNYFYISLDTRVWKLHYKNIFTELAAVSSNVTGSTFLLPKKYFAAHYLSYKPAPWFEVGLFEAVIFSREDHFEFQYLNPIILYRTVEQLLDSPDNVLLGLNGKINLPKGIMLYGQFVLDELRFNRLFDGSGWWGNKYGLQVGLRLYDAIGIQGLDLQLELNQVRPFTYSHLWSIEGNVNYSTANYSHFNQPLAHPLGSNFREGLFRANYNWKDKWFVEARVLLAQKGYNANGVNYGANILLPNGTREGDFDQFLLQGDTRRLLSFSTVISYAVFHNVKLQATVRRYDDPIFQNSNYFGLGIAVNTFDYPLDY